jgi:hypothetical protein
MARFLVCLRREVSVKKIAVYLLAIVAVLNGILGINTSTSTISTVNGWFLIGLGVVVLGLQLQINQLKKK